MNSVAMQRGASAIQGKDPQEAVHWFRQAVSEDPKNAQARACLGQSLCWLGRREEGIACLREAGSLLAKKAKKSKEIGLLLGLTEQLQHWNDFHGALQLGRQAVQINGREVRGFQLLSLSYLHLNQLKAALESARQAVKLVPHSATLQILLATIEIEGKHYEPARKRLEKVLQGSINAQERFRANKELARLLDKTGEFSQVFSCLHAAAEAAEKVPEVQTQDRRLVPNMIRDNRAGFTGELMGRWAALEFPKDQPAPIFVVGFMRSGTTLTQEVLDGHGEVFVADETDFVSSLYQELHRMLPGRRSTAEKLGEIDEAGIRHLRFHYWQLVRLRYGDRLGSRRLVDKTTMNTIDLGLINCVFPDARVVFVMRDPRDVCLSCFMQVMIPTPSTVHLLTWKGTAEFYAQVMDWWRYVKGEMVTPYLEFRYEDAVTDFESTFRQVFDFLGLPWDAGVKDFHRRAAGKYVNSPSFAQVAQPLYSSSVARWKHYEGEFAAIAPVLDPFLS